MPNPLPAISRAWDTKPTATALPLVMIPTGIVALIFGDGASKAFNNFGGATLIRILGFALALGGVLVVTSITRNDALLEALGFAAASFGAIIYGVGVILGLHTQGLIAGLFALGTAVGFLGRIRLLMRAGRVATTNQGGS